MYGADYASFGVRIKLIEEDSKNSRAFKDALPQLSSVASGQRLPFAIKFGLIDHYGQLVATDNDSTCDILPVNSNSTTLSGQTRVTSSKGVYEFTEVYVTSEPGTIVSFKISSAALNSTVADNSLTLPLQLRTCVSGETYEGNSCKVCDSGTFSLSPEKACESCPQGAICFGGNLMVPKAGYWRSSKMSEEFLECMLKSACLRSPYVIPSMTGECNYGYRGNLCQACDNGFSRVSENKCAKCPSQDDNMPKLIGLALISIAVSAVLVWTTMRTAHEPSSLHSIYLKIFTNYLQLVILATQLNLDWPDFVLDFFEKQKLASSVDQQLYSFDCYLLKEDDSEEAYKRVYFQRLVLLSTLPLALAFFSVVFWMGVYMKTHKAGYLRKELVTTLVVLFFLVHPSLVKEYFSVFSCRELDGTSLWLTYNLDIQCFADPHSFYAVSVALPYILIWGFGVPTSILIFLVSRKARLKVFLFVLIVMVNASFLYFFAFSFMSALLKRHAAKLDAAPSELI
mmetsp:Transcript_10585/g.20407  ORF Transcript_10585/g.20407 Transcript_10585/m.20407 type:complete len:511 (+) Transcript_10585:842-2374(+)